MNEEKTRRKIARRATRLPDANAAEQAGEIVRGLI
jgi:hypothetical protein